MEKYLWIIASTIKLGENTSESFPLPKNGGEKHLNHLHYQKMGAKNLWIIVITIKLRRMGVSGSNFKERKWISMLFPQKYMWAKGFIYIFLKINLGLYIGKPKKPPYVNNSPNQNFKPLNFSHRWNFAPKITYVCNVLHITLSSKCDEHFLTVQWDIHIPTPQCDKKFQMSQCVEHSNLVIRRTCPNVPI